MTEDVYFLILDFFMGVTQLSEMGVRGRNATSGLQSGFRATFKASWDLDKLNLIFQPKWQTLQRYRRGQKGLGGIGGGRAGGSKWRRKSRRCVTNKKAREGEVGRKQTRGTPQSPLPIFKLLGGFTTGNWTLCILGGLI